MKGWAGLGWAGLGWAGLGWAGLGCARSLLVDENFDWYVYIQDYALINY